MNGLELHRTFFQECGLPLLAKVFPKESPLLAVGSVGFGSERLGADDEHSRDHCWEPGFQLFSHRVGKDRLIEIEGYLFTHLPWEFRGFRRSDCRGSPNTIRAWTVDEFFQQMTSCAHPPKDDLSWLNITEEALCHVTNGEVFHDPAGDFSRRRDAFAYYPHSVWLFKLAARSHRAEMLYELARALRHGEGITAELILADGIREVMKFVFLANRCYAPYDRWLHWGFRRLRVLTPVIQPLVEKLYRRHDWVDRHAACSEMVNACAGWAQEAGLVASTECWWRDLRKQVVGPLQQYPPGWVGAEYRYGSQFSLGGDFRKLYGPTS